MGSEDNVKNFEKIAVDPLEPLVLRPPVGSEVYGSPPSRRTSRSRPFILGSLFVLFTLLMIASVFLLLYILGYRPLTSLNHKGNAHRSICRIRIPFLKIDPVESITTDDNFLNVTLSEVPYYNVIRILHLFSEGLTVIRTNKHCYIRPLRAELRGSGIEDYLRRLNIQWKVILSPSLAFRLVSTRPPISGYKGDIMPAMPDESLKPGNPDPFVGDYDNSDQADILRILLPDRENIRRVRSVDMAPEMQDKSRKLTKSNISKCEIVDVLLEDATITSTHDNHPVPILRDVIMSCS
ncbi:hypothetical protein Smp_176080 [Schistosoma mansoni]|uniref:hypothetical protein n=1 Tax=Schistosoma mansoni TaxID=6183 RepID=UPI00022C8133|nr:hypothetical protein Smp_176080 [Schistosoma mansoni]|eukprot:XP_018645198.1 hypothetical protein Smp_176080 [Schistosoma mansoni]